MSPPLRVVVAADREPVGPPGRPGVRAFV